MVQTASVSFAYKLAYHTAPALLGVKPANLFSLNRQEYDLEREIQKFRRNTERQRLRIRVICRCENRALLLVFRTDLMEELLRDSKRRAVLIPFGYDESWDTEACLTRLSSRISNNAEFPHETGIFLGYPPADVLGFIRNQGENCKLCGFWKVYDDLEQARHTFAVYDQCRKALCGQLEQGQDLYQALPAFWSMQTERHMAAASAAKL